MENEQIQLGTVIVLRPDITQEEVNEFLQQVDKFIDKNAYLAGEPTIRQFEPKHGGPVWYVP